MPISRSSRRTTHATSITGCPRQYEEQGSARSGHMTEVWRKTFDGTVESNVLTIDIVALSGRSDLFGQKGTI